MQSINFNQAPKIQTSSAVKHLSTASAYVTENSKEDSVTFTGKKKEANKKSFSFKKAVGAVISAAIAVVLYLIGKLAAEPKKTDIKTDKVAEADIKYTPDTKNAPTVEAEPKAEITPKTNVVKPEAGTLEVTEPAVNKAIEAEEPVDEAAKENLKLLNDTEKEIKEFGRTLQEESKEIHADALERVNKLAKIVKNYGKDSDGKSVGEMKYNLDKNTYSLKLNKGEKEPCDFITLEIGTDRVLGAHLGFEDGLVININSDVMSCYKDKGNKNYFFNRNKNDELKAFMGYDPDSKIEKIADFLNGEVSEYTEMSMKHRIPVLYPRYACFTGGEMVRYYENANFEDGNIKFTKGFAKTFGGTWDDLTKDK